MSSDLKSYKKLGAVILAAGKGSRMKSGNTNKVALFFADKPLILHSISLLESMSFGQIIVVVGFAKDSVKTVLKNSKVVFAEQKKRLGTGHAVKSAYQKLNPKIVDVLILYGDDSHFYKKKTISDLVKTHLASGASLTFLTITVENPYGLGRIVRDKNGKVTAIVEEKDSTKEIQNINEVNPACYIFKVNFLKKYISKIEKSPVTGEYYLTSLIDIAIRNNEKLETMRAGKISWRGINTKEELEEAEKLHRLSVE